MLQVWTQVGDQGDEETKVLPLLQDVQVGEGEDFGCGGGQVNSPAEEDAGAAFQRFLEGFKRRRPEWFVGGSPYVTPRKAPAVRQEAPAAEPAKDWKSEVADHDDAEVFEDDLYVVEGEEEEEGG